MTWPTRKLGKVCEIIAGQAPPSEFYNIDGKGKPFIKVNSFGEIYPKIDTWTIKSLKESTDRDVLFSVAGSLGLVNLGVNACITRSVFALRPKADFISQKFLFYFLKFTERIFKNLGQGSAQKIVTINQVANFEISLPPLPEQKKIVYVLDSIQSAVRVQEEIIEKTQELKRNLMYKFFKEEVVKKSKIKNQKSKSQFVIKKRVKLKEIAEIIMGQSPPSESYNANSEDLPFLQGKAEFNEIYPRPVKWCSKPIKIAEKGDILISVRAPVGDVNLANQKYCIGRGLAAIRLRIDFNNFYLFNYLQVVKENISNQGSGSTFKAINRGVLENFEIPIVSLFEQRKIANILQIIDQKIEVEQKKKTLYEELFKTMLNKLMNREIQTDNLRI